jgi:hypothetical protein
MTRPLSTTYRLRHMAGWLVRQLRGAGQVHPADIALERLAYAERYRMPEASALYCGVISTLVRSYIEDRFHLRAREMTTAEFLAGLRDDAPLVLQENRPTLERILACCDIAQTDRYELSEAELKSAHDAARMLIDATRHASDEAPGPIDYARPTARACNVAGRRARRWAGG